MVRFVSLLYYTATAAWLNLLIDETEEQVLKFSCVVGPVDNVTIVLQIKLGLSSKLAPEILGRV